MSLFDSIDDGSHVDGQPRQDELVEAPGAAARHKLTRESALRATALIPELSAQWARIGHETVTGGGPGMMESAPMGTRKMIVEKTRALFDESSSAYPQLRLLGNGAFDAASKAALGNLAPCDEEFEELKIEEESSRFIQEMRALLRDRALSLGIELIFEEATSSWEKEIRTYINLEKELRTYGRSLSNIWRE